MTHRFPFANRAWCETRNFLLRHGGKTASIMAPVPFLEIFPNAYHYHLDTLLPLEIYDFVVVHKGMLESLSLECLEAINLKMTPVFANAVFVVYARGMKMPLWLQLREKHLLPVREYIANKQQTQEKQFGTGQFESQVAIIVCAYRRPAVLRRSLPQIVDMGAPVLVVVDGTDHPDAQQCVELANEYGVIVLAIPTNRGLCCAMNAGLSYWLADPSVEWISVFQDDVDVNRKTLAVLAEVSDRTKYPLMTGYYAPEHPVLNTGILNGHPVMFQRSAPGVHLHAHREYWSRVLPIPTPYLSAPKPAGGRSGQGADEDWWITAWSPNSVTKQGLMVVCIPDLVTHMDADMAESTWQRSP
jgi:hypothetical protein